MDQTAALAADFAIDARLEDARQTLREIEQADTYAGALWELDDLIEQMRSIRDQLLLLACEDEGTADVAAILGVTSQAISQQKATARARITERQRRGS